MRILVHLSDLHFGRVDEAVLAPLRECIEAIAPHLACFDRIERPSRRHGIKPQHLRQLTL